MNKKPLISVVTVVFNAGDLLERTISSIRNQDYPEIEYIVVDGNSSDNTISVIEANQDIIQQWISEPDEGLYDAMNKGLGMAHGDYVWFINAGDVIYENNVLSKIFSAGFEPGDIYYGETMIIDKEGREIGMRRLKAPEILSWKSLINGMVVCHQSFIVRREMAPLYDLNYKIAADYLWMLQCLKNASKITNTHFILTGFLDGGLNKNNIRRALSERFGIMVKYFGPFRVFVMHFLISVRFFIYVIRNRRF